MTEILSGVAQSFFGKGGLEQMPGNAENEWRHQQYYNHMQTLTSQWPDGQGSQMGGMQDVDLRIFDRGNHQPFAGYYGGGSGQLISPSFSYHGEDVEVPTPSTGGFPTEATEGYHPAQHNESYLRPPASHGHGAVSTASPKSAHGDLSPSYQHRYPEDIASKNTRPPISRSATAPEPQQSAALKRSGSSDEDEDYMPPEEAKGSGGRGRKRQRIPHTAVERRYRENLNAHLDKLRQSVPTLAARPTGKGSTSSCQEGVKPSKCEILNGAIEHIAALDKENSGLRDEVKMLRARIEEMERWHRNNARGNSY